MNRALRAATVGVLLLTPVALSSCSSGQINQTSTQNRDKSGAGATVGPLVLREISLVFPNGGTYAQGSDAELGLAVVNTSEQPDVLVSVTGDDFTGVRLSSTGTGTESSNSASSSLSSAPGSPVGTVPPNGIPSTTSGSTTGSATGSTSGSSAASVPTTSATTPTAATTAATGIAGATGTPTATTSVSSPAAGGTSVALPVPPDSSLFLGDNAPHLFLTGLARPLTAGQSVKLTLTFQRAGAVTVMAMVSGPTSYVPNPSSYDFQQPTQAQIPGNEGGGGGIAEQTGSNG